MFHVKEQQARIDALCEMSGTVSAEGQEEAPLVVVLLRRAQVAEGGSRPSWRIVDHFVLEGAGPWQFRASAADYAVAAFQDLSHDLKLQPDEPYLSVHESRLFKCRSGERYPEVALSIPASGRAPVSEALDISKLVARAIDDQLAISLAQVTAVGELAQLGDERFSMAGGRGWAMAAVRFSV